MGYLPERKARTIYVTGSTVAQDGRKLKVVLESRPEYAIVKLQGSKIRYPIAWEAIFELAKKQNAQNLRAEARARKETKAPGGGNKK